MVGACLPPFVARFWAIILIVFLRFVFCDFQGHPSGCPFSYTKGRHIARTAGMSQYVMREEVVRLAASL